MESREKIEAVQRMQNYIEEHITETITLHSLAKAAGYSPWHSARIFKELTGKTAFEYIRAFRLFFLPDSVRGYYLTMKKGRDSMNEKTGLNTVFVQVIERPARKLILKRGIKATHYFEYCEEVGCDVWEVISNISEARYEPIGMWLPENLRKPNTSVYAQGVEVPLDYQGEVPEGYEIIQLPPCKMMVFQGLSFEDDKFEEAIGNLWEVMKNYKPEIYGFEWADTDAPRFQLQPMGYRGYIEGRPVRQIGGK